MKKLQKLQKRKGFTLTELAIVIAVIAILIAVLVPTFVSLINSANESADEQAVKSMNTALATDEALNGRKTNPSEAMQVLKDYGYNVENYQALDSNNVIYWNSETNRTLLYSTSENAVIYPSDAASTYTNLTADNLPKYWYELSTAYKTVTYDSSKTFAKNITDLNDGETLQLTKDVTADCATPSTEEKSYYEEYYEEAWSDDDGKYDITVTAINPFMLFNKDITIDLNGYTLTTTVSVYMDWSYTDNNGTTSGTNYADKTTTISNNTSVYIKNGTIVDGSGVSDSEAAIAVESGSSITLENVTFTSNGAPLFPYGNAAQVNVINSTITSSGYYCVGTNSATIDNYGVIINLSNSTLTAGCEDGSCAVMLNVAGTLNIDNCVITGELQGVYVRAGTATITNSVISCRQSTTSLSANTKWTTDTAWGEGNAAATGAVVVGNDRSNSYLADAIVTLDGCTLLYEITGSDASSYSEYEIGLYLMRKNSTTYKTEVTVSDTSIDGKVINVCDSGCTSDLLGNYTGTVYTTWDSTNSKWTTGS